jgi:hypothetical protein
MALHKAKDILFPWRRLCNIYDLIGRYWFPIFVYSDAGLLASLLHPKNRHSALKH